MHKTLKERLNFLVDNLAKSQRAFANKIGVPSNTLNNYIKGDTKPNAELLEAIAKSFSEVNTDWLLTGKGEPLLIHTDVSDIEQMLSKNGISVLLFQKDNLINEKDARIKNLEKQIEQMQKTLDYFLEREDRQGA